MGTNRDGGGVSSSVASCALFLDSVINSALANDMNAKNIKSAAAAPRTQYQTPLSGVFPTRAAAEASLVRPNRPSKNPNEKDTPR